MRDGIVEEAVGQENQHGGTGMNDEKETGMKKREIRLDMKRMRQSMDPEEKQAADDRICDFLMNLATEEAWDMVYCYVSYGTEIDTIKLIRRLLGRGIQVAVPRVEDAGEGRMDFYCIRHMTELTSGFQGIPEPVKECPKAENRLAPVITPGLAFTKSGARIGYGGGYYDRFFAREPEHLRIGVAYEFQIRKELPAEETDLRIQRIVTDAGIGDCDVG